MWPNALRALLILAASNIVNAQTATVETPPQQDAAVVTFGQTQSDFRPLTQRERTQAYVKRFYSPVGFLTTGISAGWGQLRDRPPEWGQGAEGYGRRYASAYAGRTVTRTLIYGLESALHEDNRYFKSTEEGVWARTRYAVASTVLARHDDGSRSFSFSRVGGTAGSAFITRTWQPDSNNKASDAVRRFGFSMGIQTGFNVAREFLPGALRKFRRAKR